MPETSFRTEAPNVAQHCQAVIRLLCSEQFLELFTIQETLGLTRPQTLAILQRLEEQSQIFRCDGWWQLVEE